ncbi:MAG: dihydrolipoyl dehydrogenase, partial [Deltaproteobacteria bacterium]
IYAIGDVVGAPLLAHKASYEGIQVAEAIAAEGKIKTKPIPWAIFTDPEIAHVGLTEEEAKARGEICVGKFPFAALGRALAVSEAEGFVKVVSDKQSEELLGVSIVGSHASDLISEGALAVTHRLKLSDLSGTIHPHPTLPEALMEAAEAAQGKAIHIKSS